MPGSGGRRTRILLTSAAMVCVAVWASLGGAQPPTDSSADSSTAPAEPSAVAAPTPKAAETFAGTDTCLACHGELARLWQRQRHTQYLMSPRRDAAGKGCEDCHGSALAHVREGVRVLPAAGRLTGTRQYKPCLQCHERTVPHGVWARSPHGKARLGCTACHAVHQDPKAPMMLKAPVNELCLSCHKGNRNQFRFNSHHPVLEGRMLCTQCHPPHGEQPRPKTVRARDALCTECHRDKAGPFVFEHDPMVGELSDGCLDCHRAHGSGNRSLLTVGGRGLCLKCHADKAVGHFPGTCWNSGCHSAIHGSNNSPRFFLR